jgi:hypothetical protein
MDAENRAVTIDMHERVEQGVTSRYPLRYPETNRHVIGATDSSNKGDFFSINNDALLRILGDGIGLLNRGVAVDEVLLLPGSTSGHAPQRT